MYEERRLVDTIWFKIGVIVLIIALIAGVVFFLEQNAANARQEKQQEAFECDRAVAPLKQKREEILAEIQDLDLQLAGGDLSYASVLIMYVQPNDVLIEDTLPVVEEYVYPCLVCCELGAFPGDENCISVAQAKELIDLGWQFGLTLTPDDDVERLSREMTDRGLPTPTFAYYPLSNFNADDPEQEEMLQRCGIRTVLQYNFVPAESEEHVLNYIAAYGFREKNCKSVLRDTVANSNTLTFTIGYNNIYERYEKRPFLSMTDLFQTYVNDGTLKVTNIQKALARRDAFAAALKDREADLNAKKADAQQRLDEVDDEITQVYHQYMAG